MIILSEESIWILIPVVALLVVALAVYLRYRKDMALIAKGGKLPTKDRAPEGDLATGLILLGLGIALYLGFFYGLGGFGAYMIAPLVLFFVGIAFLLLYWAKKPKKEKKVKSKVKKKKKR